jgi:hypothetical protein
MLVKLNITLLMYNTFSYQEISRKRFWQIRMQPRYYMTRVFCLGALVFADSNFAVDSMMTIRAFYWPRQTQPKNWNYWQNNLNGQTKIWSCDSVVFCAFSIRFQF